ncbi:uncharacterized protein LOC144822315 isoform X3 [Lissotriton helveticus]
MKNRKDLSRNASEKAPITFCDVAACFSEEEWKLLHDWQKGLYKNVMNEIQQALLSLGPVIATSVFSLRPKGTEDHHLSDHGDVLVGCSLNVSEGTTAHSDVLLRKTGPTKQAQMDHEDTGQSESSDGTFAGYALRTSEDVLKMEHELDLGLMDPYGTDEQETSSHLSLAGHADILPIPFRIKEEGEIYSSGHLDSEKRENKDNATEHLIQNTEEEPHLRNIHDVENEDRSIYLNQGPGVTPSAAPICIKDEGDNYPLSFQDFKKIGSICKPTGGWVPKRTCDDGKSVRYNENNIPYKASSEKVNVEVKEIFNNIETDSRFQLFSKRNRSLGRLKGNTYESIYGNKSDANSFHGNLNMEENKKCNTYESNLCHAQVFKGHAEEPKKWKLCTMPESEKGFTEHHNLHTTLSLESSTYQCKECDKSFSQKGQLIYHKRIHSKKRPYHCTECEKSFSQKHRLLGHQRTHLGERPFQCAKCKKIFSWKESLHRHYKTHTGERPFQCATCNKRFSRREGLIRHQRTHMNDNPTIKEEEEISNISPVKTELNTFMQLDTL